MWSKARTRLQKIGKIEQPIVRKAQNKPVRNPDPQSASPLFAVLPTEIRLQIFSDAVSLYSDTTKPYPFDSYHYRPGYTAPKRTDLSLLRTCKRAYEEAKDLVWKAGSGNGEKTFWWCADFKAPPRALSKPPGPRQVQQHTWSSPWSRGHTIHIFSNIFILHMRPFFSLFAIQTCGLRPHSVKLTVRYMDWWLGSNDVDSPLDLRPIAPRDDEEYFPHSVQTFILELELGEDKEEELDELVKAIVDNRMAWRWKRRDGVFLELDTHVGVTEWDWIGTTRYSYGPGFEHHPQGDSTTKYIVKVLTFSAKPSSGPE
jgi:hypothetical protein